MRRTGPYAGLWGLTSLQVGQRKRSKKPKKASSSKPQESSLCWNKRPRGKAGRVTVRKTRLYGLCHPFSSMCTLSEDRISCMLGPLYSPSLTGPHSPPGPVEQLRGPGRTRRRGCTCRHILPGPAGNVLGNAGEIANTTGPGLGKSRAQSAAWKGPPGRSHLWALPAARL